MTRGRILVLVLVAGAVAVSVLGVFLTPMGCELRGGRWGSGVGVCIARSCHYSDSCGHRANPISECAAVHIGDSRAEVYFRLGQPVGGRGDQVFWVADKVSGGLIRAEFDQERLTRLDCAGADIPMPAQ